MRGRIYFATLAKNNTKLTRLGKATQYNIVEKK